jgi:hypothetical protein
MRMYITEQYHIKGTEMWRECTSQSNITSKVKRCDENVHHRDISLPLMWYCSVMYILVTSLYLWCDIALWCTFSSHLFTFDVILLCDVHSHHISLQQYHIKGKEMWWECTSQSNITSKVKRCDENGHHRTISHQR